MPCDLLKCSQTFCSVKVERLRPQFRLRLPLPRWCSSSIRHREMLLILLLLLLSWLSAVAVVAIGFTSRAAECARQENVAVRGRDLCAERGALVGSCWGSRESSIAAVNRSRPRSSKWLLVACARASSSDCTCNEPISIHGRMSSRHMLRSIDRSGADRDLAGGRRRSTPGMTTTAFVVPNGWPSFEAPTSGGLRLPVLGARYSIPTCDGVNWSRRDPRASACSRRLSQRFVAALGGLRTKGAALSVVLRMEDGHLPSIRHRRTGKNLGNFFELDAGAENMEAGDERGLGGTSIKGELRRPLLITIGPQCSGKSTLLRDVGSSEAVTDVAIDDHPSVS